MKEFDSNDIAENKAVASISYISLLFILPLFLKKDSPFVQEHAKQGLILFLFELLGTIIFYLPFIGRVLGSIILVICLIVSIVGFLVAITGSFVAFPIIHDLAKEIKI